MVVAYLVGKFPAHFFVYFLWLLKSIYYTSPHWKDYELLDSGDGLKLERFGSYTFVRPEVQALWRPSLPDSSWDSAHAVFQPSGEESGGHWVFRKKIPEQWEMNYALSLDRFCRVGDWFGRESGTALFGNDHPWAAPGSLPGMCLSSGIGWADLIFTRCHSTSLPRTTPEYPEFIRIYRVGYFGLCSCRCEGHACGCIEEIRKLGACKSGPFRACRETSPLDRG